MINSFPGPSKGLHEVAANGEEMQGIRKLARWMRRAGLAILSAADRAVNRLYGHRLNPLYHSGVLVVTMLVVLLVTGLYLVFFYRIGDPYASVSRITGQAWSGRWIRGLHRFSADAAVVAAAVHAFRLFAQGRSWGPRALAWVSGVLLFGTLLVCGWTGYVMVWDEQARLLAAEGARFLDALPIFSEPIGRTFVGERALPSAFFFLNLFLHIALPVGTFILLWLHVSRVARPVLAPPRPLMWGTVLLLVAVSVAWPLGMEPEADLLRIPDRPALDLFYAFWYPMTRLLPAGAVWALGAAALLVAVFVPRWSRPSAADRPAASRVSDRLCTGCEQCYLDCPYEAIRMVSGEGDRRSLVASVDPALCVSCGICAGSCAPMGIGPPGLTGREQLAEVERLIARLRPTGSEVVIVGCRHSAAGHAPLADGDALLPVPCGGNLHSSVVEYLVRAGVGGVLLVACPPRDCWSREGPKWLVARLYEDREAELKARVDRDRIEVVHAAPGEARRVAEVVAALRERAARKRSEGEEGRIQVEAECEVEPRPAAGVS